VAFAKLDPATNTQYLESYIEIHASNRYRHYRSRSLAMLLDPILQYPDPSWVRQRVQQIATAALTVASMDFEDFLPLAVRGVQANAGDPVAVAELDAARQRLEAGAAGLDPDQGRTDSWSHLHRTASALAEVFAVALGRANEAAELLRLARGLPKGFAGFRAPSALTLAESTRIAAPADAAAYDAALTSAQAASHRIQDYQYCLQMTAMVNAMRARWADMSQMDVADTIGRFLDDPLAAEFCAVHRVGEQFQFRAQDQDKFQALPIPDEVGQARSLRAIADIFDVKPDTLRLANNWIWGATPEAILIEPLQDGDEVSIPDPDFVPLLAARLAAEVSVANGLLPEQRSSLIQRLVRLTLPNPTAVDAVLARLILSTVQRPQPLPKVLVDLRLSASSPPGAPVGRQGLGAM
jgi:hypothetical protein